MHFSTYFVLNVDKQIIVDKYAVAAIKKCKVVKHLMNGKSGKFAKFVFFSES